MGRCRFHDAYITCRETDFVTGVGVGCQRPCGIAGNPAGNGTGKLALHLKEQAPDGGSNPTVRSGGGRTRIRVPFLQVGRWASNPMVHAAAKAWAVSRPLIDRVSTSAGASS